jgi:hypothetical protein
MDELTLVAQLRDGYPAGIDLTEPERRLAAEISAARRRPRAWGRSRLARSLAPVAAVAAVIAVITGVYAVGRSPGQRTASPEAPGVMPPYYVTIQNTHVGAAVPLTVRDSATGRVLATLQLPFLFGGTQEITGAADDRTFVIHDGNDLFRLRLAADGRPARLARLPVTVPAWDTIALSPDGRTIAFENQSSCQPIWSTGSGLAGETGCRESTIGLVSLATGATRTWSTRSSWQAGIWIAWDGNDHVLFSWARARDSGPRPSGYPSGYRLLDVSGPGGDLLGARLLPLPPLPVFGAVAFPQTAFITPDGSAVIAATFSLVGSSTSPTGIVKIVELSARTGRLLRVLRQSRNNYFAEDNQGCSVYSLGPTGVHALIECPSSPETVFGRLDNGPVFGRLDNGRFTPLPGGPALGDDPFLPAAAW